MRTNVSLNRSTGTSENVSDGFLVDSSTGAPEPAVITGLGAPVPGDYNPHDFSNGSISRITNEPQSSGLSSNAQVREPGETLESETAGSEPVSTGEAHS